MGNMKISAVAGIWMLHRSSYCGKSRCWRPLMTSNYVHQVNVAGGTWPSATLFLFEQRDAWERHSKILWSSEQTCPSKQYVFLYLKSHPPQSFTEQCNYISVFSPWIGRKFYKCDLSFIAFSVTMATWFTVHWRYASHKILVDRPSPQYILYAQCLNGYRKETQNSTFFLVITLLLLFLHKSTFLKYVWSNCMEDNCR
jgi:hypothetical protein